MDRIPRYIRTYLYLSPYNMQTNVCFSIRSFVCLASTRPSTSPWRSEIGVSGLFLTRSLDDSRYPRLLVYGARAPLSRLQAVGRILSPLSSLFVALFSELHRKRPALIIA